MQLTLRLTHKLKFKKKKSKQTRSLTHVFDVFVNLKNILINLQSQFISLWTIITQINIELEKYLMKTNAKNFHFYSKKKMNSIAKYVEKTQNRRQRDKSDRSIFEYNQSEKTWLRYFIE